MSTMLPPQPVASSSTHGLKVAMTVFAALGFAVWGNSIGFLIGWGYVDYGIARTIYGIILTVPTNVAMIYVAARLIFIVMDKSFPTPSSVQDLHQNVGRMVAFSVVGFTTWVISAVWLSKYTTDVESFVVYHVCNYGFVFAVLVAGLAGGVLRKVNVAVHQSPPSPQPLRGQDPKYNTARSDGSPMSHAHYNPAYSHYGGQRMYN